MKLNDLIELANEGKLTVAKTPYRIYRREKGWRGQKWDDQTNPSWDKTIIEYQMYSYTARTADMPENSFYKITKTDYTKLQALCKPPQCP